MQTIINGKTVWFNANFVGGFYTEEETPEFDLPRIQTIVYNNNDLFEQDKLDLYEYLLDVWFDNEGEVPEEWKNKIIIEGVYKKKFSSYAPAGNNISLISKLLLKGFKPSIPNYNLQSTLVTL